MLLSFFFFLLLLSSSLVYSTVCAVVHVCSIRSNSYSHWIMRVLRLTDWLWVRRKLWIFYESKRFSLYVNMSAKHSTELAGIFFFLVPISISLSSPSCRGHGVVTIQIWIHPLSSLIADRRHRSCCQFINETEYVKVSIHAIFWCVYGHGKRILLTDNSVWVCKIFFLHK